MHFQSRFLLFTPLLYALLSSCGGTEAPDPKKNQKPPAIEGFIVKPQHVEDRVVVSGKLIPMDEATLMPETAGRITLLHLPEGGHVSKGTLLVKLYDADLQAQLQKLQAQLKTARTTEQRQKELLNMDGVSKQEYDIAATAVVALEADVAGVNAAISKTEIRAPFDGTIGLRNVSEGAYVSPGTAIAVIRADQQLKLDFSVPGAYAGDVKPGLSVSFTIDGDTAMYTADVLASEQSIDQDAMSLHVRALVKEKHAKLVPGAAATVSVGLGANDNALMIPTQAVIPQARFKSVIVARNGKAEMAKVTTGIRRPADVEILTGLKPGDTIAITGIQFIRPGMPLKFTSTRDK